MERATVFHVEDDPGVRELVEKLLTSAGLNVLSFDDPNKFLEAYDPDCLGCAVVDVCLPGLSGLDLQSTLADKVIGRPHIMLTGHADVAMAVQALTRGAMGFLEKPFRAHELLTLVHRAIDLDRINRESKRRRKDIVRRVDSLTAREREVLDLVVQGEQNKNIAIRLDISQRTVELHRSRVMEKLEVNSIAELVQLVMAHGDTQNPHC